MDARKEVLALLREFKCQPLRHKNHVVYKLPDGKSYTIPKSASDRWAWDNCLSDLKIALGLSKRGRQATTGGRSVQKKTKQRTPPTPTSITPAPVGFNFGEKVRAALKGEKPSHPEVLPPEKEKPTVRFRKPITRRAQGERHGAVRVWSKSEIEAANIAMRMGKLDHYMHEYERATIPTSQPKEKTMLTVEQMDSTVQELAAGMAAAIEEQKLEQATISRLTQEIEQAQQRLQAAHEKHNSLADVKTSLDVLRGDIERVRPMLGHIAHKPEATPTTAARIPHDRLAQVVAKVLDATDTPLKISDIQAALRSWPGYQNVSRQVLYNFFYQEPKRNGSAVAVKVKMGMGAPTMYWRAGRPRTQEGAA